MGRRVALVLYDGDCGICSGLAAWLAEHGIRVAPIRSAVGDVELRDLGRARREATAHAIDDSGRRRSGADAIAPVLRSLPRLAWSARLVEAVPAPFAWSYALIARHRRRLSRLAGLRGCTPVSREQPAGSDRGRRRARARAARRVS